MTKLGLYRTFAMAGAVALAATSVAVACTTKSATVIGRMSVASAPAGSQCAATAGAGATCSVFEVMSATNSDGLALGDLTGKTLKAIMPSGMAMPASNPVEAIWVAKADINWEKGSLQIASVEPASEPVAMAAKASWEKCMTATALAGAGGKAGCCMSGASTAKMDAATAGSKGSCGASAATANSKGSCASKMDAATASTAGSGSCASKADAATAGSKGSCASKADAATASTAGSKGSCGTSAATASTAGSKDGCCASKASAATASSKGSCGSKADGATASSKGSCGSKADAATANSKGACSDKSAKSAAAAAAARALTFNVNGMTCKNCVSKVEQALMNVKGVASATVDLEKKNATVNAEEGVKAEDLVKAIKDAGFEAQVASTEKTSEARG